MRSLKLVLALPLTALLLLTGLASDANAQRPYGERYDRDSRGRNDQPGVFDYYVLSLSWSPTYCADRTDTGYEPQCDLRRRTRPYAFVLHGLWPQYTRGWPQHCRSADRGYVPRPVANRMRDIMPSDKLIFNEYRKHGTCSGLGVDGYFDLARRLHDSIKIPARFTGLSDDRLTISPDELVSDFLSANPALKPDMIAVVCGGSGNRLREVRICFDKGGRLRSCGHNEDQRRLCSASRMYVPPVRGGSGGGDRERGEQGPADRPPPASGGSGKPDYLPGPR